MNEDENYYALLGVPENADEAEIKRHYNNMRRKYAEDQEMTEKLNRAREVLFNPDERRQYDVERRFRKRIQDFLSALKNCDSEDRQRRLMAEGRRLYKEVLEVDPGNLDALRYLYDIEMYFGDEASAERCLCRLEERVRTLDNRNEALDYWQWLRDKSMESGQTEHTEAAFKAIYESDADDEKNNISYARLLYDVKHDAKAALGVLDACVERTKKDFARMRYLCEALRIIKQSGADHGRQTAVIDKMEKLAGPGNDATALGMIPLMAACIRDCETALFRKLEKIYRACGVTNGEIKEKFEMLRQLADVIDAGKFHKAVAMLLSDDLNDKVLERIAYCVVDDAAGVMASLDYIRDNAPLAWNSFGIIAALAEKTKQNLRSAKDLASMRNDQNISMDLKRLLELLILCSVANTDSLIEELKAAADSFFQDGAPELQRQSLIRVETYYPESYERLAGIFLDGHSTDELFSQQNTESRRRDKWQEKQPQSDGVRTGDTGYSTEKPKKKKASIIFKLLAGLIAFLMLGELLENVSYALDLSEFGEGIILFGLIALIVKAVSSHRKKNSSDNSYPAAQQEDMSEADETPDTTHRGSALHTDTEEYRSDVTGKTNAQAGTEDRKSDTVENAQPKTGGTVQKPSEAEMDMEQTPEGTENVLKVTEQTPAVTKALNAAGKSGPPGKRSRKKIVGAAIGVAAVLCVCLLVKGLLANNTDNAGSENYGGYTLTAEESSVEDKRFADLSFQMQVSELADYLGCLPENLVYTNKRTDTGDTIEGFGYVDTDGFMADFVITYSEEGGAHATYSNGDTIAMERNFFQNSSNLWYIYEKGKEDSGVSDEEVEEQQKLIAEYIGCSVDALEYCGMRDGIPEYRFVNGKPEFRVFIKGKLWAYYEGESPWQVEPGSYEMYVDDYSPEDSSSGNRDDNYLWGDTYADDEAQSIQDRVQSYVSAAGLDDRTAAKYTEIVANATNGTLPFNKTCEVDADSHFAIADIDADNTKELLLQVFVNENDGQDIHVVHYVYDYNASTNHLTEQCYINYSYDVAFFNNGSVITWWGEHDLGGDIQPYTVYEYTNNSNYNLVATVQSWDKNTASWDNDGNPFPYYVDLDNDGIIYNVNWDSDYSYDHWVDGAEFENLVRELEKRYGTTEEKQIKLDWQYYRNEAYN